MSTMGNELLSIIKFVELNNELKQNKKGVVAYTV
jgi:hypothetical protein